MTVLWFSPRAKTYMPIGATYWHRKTVESWRSDQCDDDFPIQGKSNNLVMTCEQTSSRINFVVR